MVTKRKVRRGATLTELLTAAAVSVLALIGATSIMISGSAAWAKGMGKIGAETEAQMSVRVIAQQLREAMAVSVDSGGMGLTFKVPSKDANGNFSVPEVPDGVLHRIEAEGNSLVLITGNTKRVLSKDLIFTDPVSNNGASAYKLFTPGSGLVTRQVTIEVATKRFGYKANTVSTRSRETIFLRNIPIVDM